MTVPLPKDRFVISEKAESLERKKVRAEKNAKGWRGAVRERSGEQPHGPSVSLVLLRTWSLVCCLCSQQEESQEYL